MKMSIRTIGDVVNSGVVEFESVDDMSASAFVSGLSGLKRSMKIVKKLYKLLEANGYQEVDCKGGHYGVLGGWRNCDNERAFEIEIRYGDMVIIREAR